MESVGVKLDRKGMFTLKINDGKCQKDGQHVLKMSCWWNIGQVGLG